MEFDYDSREIGEIDAPDFTTIQTPGLSHAVKRIDLYYFNDETERWEKYQQAHQSTKRQKTLSFLSWNLWFGKSFLENRNCEVANTIKQLDPDIVALQQATPSILRILQKETFVRNNYYIAEENGSTLKPYGVLFLVKFPLSDITLRPLVSKTGRELLIAQLRINKTDIWINGACLEPQNTATEMRLSQSKSMNMKVSAQENSFLLLSANSWGEAEQKTLTDCYNDFKDAWTVVHPNSKVTTIDTTSNKMINKEIIAKGGIPQRRHDRADFILYKSNIWTPISAQLVGTTPIKVPVNQKCEGQTVEGRKESLENIKGIHPEPSLDGEGMKKKEKTKKDTVHDVYPSTHFGVFVEFAC